MQPRSRRSPLIALLVINGALLLILAAVTFTPVVEAQIRPRGDYVMGTGGINGSDAGAVYVIDTVNREMIAMQYNYNNAALEMLGYRNLAVDVNNAVRQRPGN